MLLTNFAATLVLAKNEEFSLPVCCITNAKSTRRVQCNFDTYNLNEDWRQLFIAIRRRKIACLIDDIEQECDEAPQFLY